MKNIENPAIKGLSDYTDKLNSLSKKQLNEFAKTMKWGTYGVKGTFPHPVYKPLGKLSTSHIKNILITQYHISSLTRKVLMYVLERRKK